MNNTIIRKVTVGKNYPDKAMHFQVGVEYNLQGVPYKLVQILENESLSERGHMAYDIFLENEGEVVLWKTLVDMPCIVENDINFE